MWGFMRAWAEDTEARVKGSVFAGVEDGIVDVEGTLGGFESCWMGLGEESWSCVEGTAGRRRVRALSHASHVAARLMSRTHYGSLTATSPSQHANRISRSPRCWFEQAR